MDSIEKISRTGRRKLPANYALMETPEKKSSSGFPVGLYKKIGSSTAPNGRYFSPDPSIQSDATSRS